MNDVTLKNARLADGSIVDVKIAQGVITEISSSIKADGPVVDLKKNLLLPGLVDLHTHLREPGKENCTKVIRSALLRNECIGSSQRPNNAVERTG